MKLRSTGDFIKVLHKEKELLVIEEEVDPDLEIAEIQRRVVAKKGPALFFLKVKGSEFPVATNLYGSEKRIELAFGRKPIELVQELARLASEIMPPSFKKLWNARNLALQGLRVGTKKISPISSEILQSKIDPPNVFKLPALRSWPEDGGRFVTLPLVYTQSPNNGKGNLGMYRIQFHDELTTGMHIQIHRGGGFHHYEAKQKKESLPCHIYVGGPPALTIAAVAPLPEELSELLIASLLLGEKLKTTKDLAISSLPIVSDADFMLVGEIPPDELRPEGPFGDHYGYYALRHDYPVFKVKNIYHRKNAIWPATVVGRPPQEDHYIAEYLQDLLSPMFPLVMPKVLSVWAYEESGVHTLAAAVVKERYPKEAFTAALRILGEGHLSLSKCLMVTNVNVELKDFKKAFITVLERINVSTDIHIFANISQDTLDYTGPAVNSGSKMLLLGVGEKRNVLKEEFLGNFQSNVFKRAKVFCPGVLCVSSEIYKKGDLMADKLLEEKCIEGFIFVFLVDDVEEACNSSHSFLWTIFTRFEPAGDVYARYEVIRNHLSYKAPIVVDCRLKDWYPKVLREDLGIVKKVEERFGKIIDSIG
ncbi:MAG: UbiD family decarboxylase [Leptospiraceae bacterium]|nr:UbiD family decarboxylase [Leptospiraceae bacterium]